MILKIVRDHDYFFYNEIKDGSKIKIIKKHSNEDYLVEVDYKYGRKKITLRKDEIINDSNIKFDKIYL